MGGVNNPVSQAARFHELRDFVKRLDKLLGIIKSFGLIKPPSLANHLASQKQLGIETA